MRQVYFITHPNVVIDPQVPVLQWPLSARGIERMRLMLQQPWVARITAVYCSIEQKAIDGANILAGHVSLPVTRVAGLGENDRSATGFLPGEEFQKVADQFFAKPEQSVRGWETAAAAQRRIVTAVDNIIAQDHTGGDIAIVAHGGVGTLLLCHLAGYAIARKHDQPGSEGGNYYVFETDTRKLLHGWKAIEDTSDSC